MTGAGRAAAGLLSVAGARSTIPPPLPSPTPAPVSVPDFRTRTHTRTRSRQERSRIGNGNGKTNGQTEEVVDSTLTLNLYL